MVYRIVGLLTGLGTLAFFGLVLNAMIAPTRPQIAVWAFFFALATIVLGLALMTWHVIFVQRSGETKKEWRTLLVYFGPFAAAAYLWGVAPQSGLATSTSSIQQVPIHAAFHPMRVSAAVVVSSMACFMTWAANRALAPFDQLPGPEEALLNYLLRIGFVISAAVLGSVLRVKFWPWIALMILPSLIAIYVVAVGASEIRIALIVAASFLAWVSSHLMNRGPAKKVDVRV